MAIAAMTWGFDKRVIILGSVGLPLCAMCLLAAYGFSLRKLSIGAFAVGALMIAAAVGHQDDWQVDQYLLIEMGIATLALGVWLLAHDADSGEVGERTGDIAGVLAVLMIFAIGGIVSFPDDAQPRYVGLVVATALLGVLQDLAGDRWKKTLAFFAVPVGLFTLFRVASRMCVQDH